MTSDEAQISMRLRLFHEAKAPVANGHRRETLLHMSDQEMETNHAYIQWAFPTPHKSKSISSAPILDLSSAIWLANNADFVKFLEDMTERFLAFLQKSQAWRHGFNHNQLRVSRIVESLRILHSYELAHWFYETVLGFISSSDPHIEKAKSIWSQKIDPKYDRIAGCFVGLAIGDALGAPVEFCRRGTFEPVTEFRAGGKFNLPAGAWTDDTAMALCLAQSLIENDDFDAKNLLSKFSAWMEIASNTSTGVCVGVGQNTLRTLGDFRRLGRLEALPFGAKNDGNGSLMRLAAVPCKYVNDLELARSISAQQSQTTHASRIASETCVYLSKLLVKLLNGKEYQSVKQSLLEQEWSYALSSVIEQNYAGYSEAGVRSGGYVLDTLQASLWSVENSDTFEAAVLKAVNLGDDADTTGAVTGQLAGALHGYSNIDHKLKSHLIDERKLYVTSQFLTLNVEHS